MPESRWRHLLRPNFWQSPATWLLLLTLVRYGGTFVREVVHSALFGAGPTLDAYLLGTNALIVLTTCVENLTYGAFLPVYNKLLAENPEEAPHLLRGLLGWLLLLGIAFGICLTWQADAVAGWIAPGFEPTRHQALATVIRQCAFPALAGSFFYTLKGFCEQQRRFLPPVLAQIVGIALSIGVTVSLGPRYGIQALTAGFLTLCVAQAAWIIGSLGAAAWHRLRPSFRMGGEASRLLKPRLAPVIGVWILWNATVLVDNAFVSTLPAGQATALAYGYRLLSMASTLLMGTLLTTTIPELNRLSAQGPVAKLPGLLSRRIGLAWLWVVPLVGVAIVLPEPLIRLCFERGRFGPADTLRTAEVFRVYMLGLMAFGGFKFLTQTLNALGANVANAWLGAGLLGLNIVLDWWLMGWLGLPGIAWATTVEFWLMFGVGCLVVHRAIQERLGHERGFSSRDGES